MAQNIVKTLKSKTPSIRTLNGLEKLPAQIQHDRPPKILKPEERKIKAGSLRMAPKVNKKDKSSWIMKNGDKVK